MTLEPMLNVGCGSRLDPRWTNIDLAATAPGVIAHNILTGLPFDDGRFAVVYHSHVIEHLERAAGARLMRECWRVLRPGGVIRVVAPDLEFSCRLYLEALGEVLAAETPLHAEHYEWALLNLIDQMTRQSPGGEMLPFLQRETLRDPAYITRSGGGGVAREAAAPSAPSAPSRWIQLKTAVKRSLRRWRKPVSAAQTGELHRWMYDRYSMRRLLHEAGFTDIAFYAADSSQIPNWGQFGLDMDDDQPYKTGSLFVEAIKPQEVSDAGQQ